RKVEPHIRAADAVHGKFMPRAVIQFRGLEQRLGRDAPGIEARAAKRMAAVEVPLAIDARDVEFVLRGADRSRVAGRTATDHDDIELLAHTPSTRRAGS